MNQIHRTEEFKRAAVQKIILRGSRSVQEVCDELGLSTPSFYEWKRKYASIPGMKPPERRPQDWSSTEKFKAVLEYESLAPEEQGEFLRRSGLHSDHLVAWKKSMELGLESAGKLNAAERTERSQDRLKIRDLERELRRKDKALAETAALLILKKKADLIWGTGEDE